MYEKSKQLYSEARKYIPGGVNSPVRAMKAVLEQPLFIERGEGSRIYDVDGNEYLDYVCSYGALILGHAHPQVLDAVNSTAQKGTSFGAPHELEIELARKVVEAVPSIEAVRMVNTGTEAVMSALRLARGFTGRNRVIKFSGCYHGHCDSFLIGAGSGAAILGCQDSPGVPVGAASDTITLPYNDAGAVKEVFAANGEEIAAVFVEPIAANMGLIMPEPGFLEALRDLTLANGSLLVFDEVITGFRVAYGGAQELFGLSPDLTILGKVLGGGLPIGAYGGRAEIMEQVAPSGPVYQAGTFAGNPLSMAAGIATLKLVGKTGFYADLERKGAKLLDGIREAARANGVAVQLEGKGSLFGIFFNENRVRDYSGASSSDVEKFNHFFRALLKNGAYIAPAQLENGFMTAAHSDEDLDQTIEAFSRAFESLKP